MQIACSVNLERSVLSEAFFLFFFFFTLNQSVQLQRPELPLTLIFCTFLKKELFDKLKMLTQLKWESFKLGGEEKVV